MLVCPSYVELASSIIPRDQIGINTGIDDPRFLFESCFNSVLEQIIFVMTPIRSKELGGGLGSFLVHWFALGVRYDHAAGKIDLRIRTDIFDLRLAVGKLQMRIGREILVRDRNNSFQNNFLFTEYLRAFPSLNLVCL